MQEVTLADEIVIRLSGTLQVHTDEDCGPPNRNLVHLAAQALADRAEVSPLAAIELKKHIPVGAGLGGGSSDGASTLIALNWYWDTDLGCGDLSALAERLGSDVPFFLTGGTALVEGRGERVTALPETGTSWYTLVNPGFHVSTGKIFNALNPGHYTSGATSRKLASEIGAGGPAGAGVNGLQAVLFDLYPAAETCFRSLQELAPGRAHVSGSGPTVFVRAEDADDAARLCASAHRLGYWAQVVRNCPTEGRDLPCRGSHA
jgi:4-diphosphocytidyl-2-C-methyl-D-erythritol kinase